jgi:hypothetical protein
VGFGLRVERELKSACRRVAPTPVSALQSALSPRLGLRKASTLAMN